MEYVHEIVVPNSDLPFKIFLFEGKDGNYVRDKHWHRSIEIFAIYEGELEFYLNDDRYTLCEGEFMLVNSNEIHSIFARKRNTTVVLQIPLAAFENYFMEGGFIYFSHGTCVQDEEIMRMISEIYQIYEEKREGYELIIRSIYYSLLYILVTRYRGAKVDSQLEKGNKKLNKLTAIISYVEENYEKDLSLEGLAKLFGYSSTYLSRMFRKYARINYKEYLNNIRLEHAYKDLMNTRMPIGDIAISNGFPNSKAFSKAFQKKYGVLPSKYRKKQ